MLRRFSCRGYRTWPCLSLSSRVSLLFVLLPTRDVSPHNFQPVRSLPFAMIICFLSARRFASLLLAFSGFTLILFLTVVLATAIFLLSFPLGIILIGYFSCNWLEKTISVRINVYLLFFVLRMFAIDLGTIVKGNFSIP